MPVATTMTGEPPGVMSSVARWLNSAPLITFDVTLLRKIVYRLPPVIEPLRKAVTTRPSGLRVISYVPLEKLSITSDDGQGAVEAAEIAEVVRVIRSARAALIICEILEMVW